METDFERSLMEEMRESGLEDWVEIEDSCDSSKFDGGKVSFHGIEMLGCHPSAHTRKGRLSMKSTNDMSSIKGTCRNGW